MCAGVTYIGTPTLSVKSICPSLGMSLTLNFKGGFASMSQSLERQVVLLDDGSPATIFPVWNINQLPLELVAALCVEYNAEIDTGRSFPQTQRLMLESFEKTWFSGISGVVLFGTDWEGLYDFDLQDNEKCLGSFTITPEYPGRSSQICTANFLVKRKARNSGVGKAMAQCFMRWAIQLGYEYALFSLVYDCNVPACKILNKLGFEVLTTLKGAGILKGFNYPVDAFMFGRSLLSESFTEHYRSLPAVQSQQDLQVQFEQPQQAYQTQQTHQAHHTQQQQHDIVQNNGSVRADNPLSTVDSTEPMNIDSALDPALDPMLDPQASAIKQVGEFENLRVYLMNGEYPPCSSRVERTRIRSRSRSYAVKNGQLYHKESNRLVVSDPHQQHLISSQIHRANHNGINKMQKEILARYYWQGVRETIKKAIKECQDCRSAGLSDIADQDIGSSSQQTPIVHLTPVGTTTTRSTTAAGTTAAPLVLDISSNQQSPIYYRDSSAQMSSVTPQREPFPDTPHQSWTTEGANQYDSPLASSQFGSPLNPLSEYATGNSDLRFIEDSSGNIVYLPPENEDDEYIPEEIDEGTTYPRENYDQHVVSDDDSLFIDANEEGEDEAPYEEDEYEDEDEDEDEDDDEDEYEDEDEEDEGENEDFDKGDQREDE